MEYEENKDTTSLEPITSKSFTFSRPSVLSSSPTATYFDSKSIFDTGFSNKQNIFTFAAPVTVSEPDACNESVFQSGSPEKQYKPKISRNTYKPSVNVFAQALKETALFGQLKKNSRSQANKINLQNSITCTNVPKALCTKATAKKHFTAFGSILKITILPKKQVITVAYASKEEATNAYYNSNEYAGEKFNVDWSKASTSPKSPTKKKDLQKNVVSGLLKTTHDDEVKAELEAMMNLEYTVHNPSKTVPETATLKRSKASHFLATSKPVTRAEKATAKSEKLKADNQVPDLMPNASVEELQNMIVQTAVTSEDKYKVLEARDRLIRLKQTKSHSLATAKLTSGTCPDMCPEKERLMRESNRQVALYEQIEGSEYRINHLKAIKQYSRSSADQEEPMAHELRPVKTLKMTMSYLLHEIANLCDELGTNLGDWYHFLWDRTRGIRKDITQQELCCPDSVELVEQCARFHIVSSERLCAEESSVFDKKINSDNLTKCLQSLKYMYHDLRVKGVTCKNEPEFRAYIILLNLNNGNFMWEVQKLPASVQQSPEVRFAIDVYSSLESNNYYKFFTLVRKTTYLNACILLRYFNQVRLKALSVMVKAYCRTTSTAYPLYELIDILGFEDENEAISFCEQMGLNVSKDEMHILLNRQNFGVLEMNVKHTRACNLIESKRVAKQLSIGQCIAGGEMPAKTYKYHKPHTSFDSRGRLKPESVNAEDQTNSKPKGVDTYDFVEEVEMKIEDSEKPQTKSEPPDIKEHHKTVLKPAITSQPIVPIFAPPKTESSFSFAPKQTTQSTEAGRPQTNARLRISSSIFATKQQDDALPMLKRTESDICGNKSTFVPSSTKSFNVFAKQPETSTSNDSVSPFSMAVNKSIFSGSSKGNIFARSSTVSNIFSSSSSTTTTHSTTGITADPTFASSMRESKPKETPTFAPSKVQAQKLPDRSTDAEKLKLEELERKEKLQRLNEDAENCFNDLQHEVVQSYCSDIVNDVLDEARAHDELCKEIADEIVEDVVRKMCTNILTEKVITERRLNEISRKMRNKVILKYLRVWQRYVHKKRQQRVALDNTPVWLQRHSLDECAKLLYSKGQDLAIHNMCKGQAEFQLEKHQPISLAPIEVIIYAGIKENLKSLDIDMYPNFYWKVIISWPELQNRIILWQHKKIMNRYLCPDNYATEPIVKVYRPNQFETLHVCIRHFEGFIADHKLIGADALLFIAAASEHSKVVARRLTKTVLSRHKLTPISLVFIVLGEGNLDAQNKEIVADLEALLESGYLSEYTIMYEKLLTEKTILTLTQSAMLWLSVNKAPPNPLEMDYLIDVYDTCLTEELWLRILGDSSFNTKLSLALREPNFVISLHNEAITHLMDIVLDPESFMYTKFAPEFKKFLKNEYTMPCSYEYFDDSWKGEDYKATLENVMSSFMLPLWMYPWPINDPNVLRQNITRYCNEALSNLDSNRVSSGILSNLFLTSGTSTVSNFVDILLYIVKEKIRDLSSELKVIYNRNHIKHFRTLPWWFKSNVLMEYKPTAEEMSRMGREKENEDQPIRKKCRVQKFDGNNSPSDSSLDELEPLAEFCENTRSQVMKVHQTSMEIEDRLKAQQRENSLLEEKIRNALFFESDIFNDSI